MMGCMHVSEWVCVWGCPGRIKEMPLGKRTGGNWIRADLWLFGKAAHLLNQPVIIHSPVSGTQSYCREMQRPPNGSVSSHTLRHGESTSDLQNVFFWVWGFLWYHQKLIGCRSTEVNSQSFRACWHVSVFCAQSLFFRKVLKTLLGFQTWIVILY